jgi:hypothetical protein
MQFSGASPSVISDSQEMGARDEESIAADCGCRAGLGCGISRLPLRGLLVAANVRQTGKRLHDMERREHLVNSKYQQQTRTLEPSDSPSKTHFERTFPGRNPMLTSANSSGNIGDPDERFRSKAVSRLYLAIVNRAILDLLENGKNSPAAKRWLVSRDFDRLQELFRPKISQYPGGDRRSLLNSTQKVSRKGGRAITKPLQLSCCGTIR